MSAEILAYHFTGPTLRDGQPIPPIGAELRHDGALEICMTGLHASRQPFDALQYAPGPLLHLVSCRDVETEQADKLVCRSRTIVATIDVTALLRRFACDQAIEALRVAGIEAPPIVAEYLRTADESLRAAARDEAMDAAAWAAAWAAARAATWDAAWGAAVWDAARDDFNARVRAALPPSE